MKIKNVLSLLLAAVMTATSIPVVAASAAPAEAVSVGVTGAGATTFTAENSGNHYLYVMNKDLKSQEGVQVEFTPVAGVTEYKVSAKVRGAGNVISTGASATVRTNTTLISGANASVGSWFGGTGATWFATTDTVTVTNTALSAKFSIAINAGDAGVLEIDDLRIYYVKNGQQKDVVFFDFEDGLLTKNGVTLTPSADVSGGYNHDGKGAIEIREENDYYRANGDKAIIDLGDDFEAGIYTLSGDFRMPYFQNTGNGRNYASGTHRAVVTVWSDGVKVGSLTPTMSTSSGGAGNINPYWRTLSIEGITVASPETEIYFTVESGITDTNEYATALKNAVDVMGLTLTKTAEYDPDKAAAEQVDALITAIGEVGDDSEDKITAARAAYTALNDTAKALVTMLSVLEDAEEAFELLPVTKPAKAVDAIISAIGEVTEDSEDTVAAARAAYNALADESKAYVTKLSVLEAAEAKLEFLTTPAPLNGVDKMGAELVGNKYLYVMNKDYGCPEGAMLEFVPVAGVTEYKITAKTRTANLYAPGVGTSIRTGALNGTCKVDSWFSSFSTMWKQAEDTIKLPGEATAFGSKIQVSFCVNSDDGNVLELDDIRVYYIDTNAQEQDVAFFDFEDGALTKNGVTITALENVNGYAQFDGPTTIEIREEQHYYRAADLTADDAGTMTFDPALEPAVYTVSGEFRMPYFQNTGASRRYDVGIHTATVVVTNGDTEIGTFDISPYWGKQEFTFSSLEPISELKFTMTSSGITDANDTAAAYKNAVDVMNLKVTKTRSFDGAVESEGFVTSLNTYSTDDLDTVTSEDGFLHIYNRAAGGDGFGFTLNGETFNQGETYTIKFLARQPLASAHATTLTLEVTKNDVRCLNYVPDTNLQNENYATIDMAKDNVHYCGSYGVGVVEGWYEYVFTFTPKDGDIENPELAFFPRYMGGYDEAYRYPDPNSTNWINAVNPMDIDWIEIFDGNGDSIFCDDFDGELDARYIPVLGNYGGNSKNAGSSKFAIEEDNHMSIVAKEGAPKLEITGFDVPELVPGKYAFTFDARLGYYEASLGFENSVASLDMAVTNTDSTTATKKTEINTEWTQVIYSFFVTEECKPEKIEITLSGIEGGVENLKRFDFKNFAVSSQIFEIETEDETSLMNGVEIYSVGDTVKTEVLAEDGVTPNGYLHMYDRPLDLHHGVAFKINTPLKGGERYIITFKARMSHTATGNTTLTVSGNGIATGYNERNSGKDYETRWAMPVIGKTPAPYFSTTQGAYVKDYWQEYSFEYAPVDDIAEPIFSLLSNYYWNNDGSGPSVRWGGQYQLNQDAIDIDDIVIYKVGDEANPIYTDNFNAGVGETYQPAEGTGGSNVGADLSRGGSNYGKGSSKLAHDNDVYESVINDTAAPELNLSNFSEFPAGKYALTVWIRNNLIYDSNKSFENQETVTMTVVATHSTAPDTAGGEEGTDVELQRYEIGHEWQQISYIFKIDESTTSLEKIRMYLDNGNQPGSFDYRDFDFELIEEEVLPAPEPGVVMMFLYKKQIRKVTNPEEFIREEKVDENIFVDKDYFEGALTEEGVAKWSAPVQTLEAGKLAGGADYIKVRNIKNNYMPISFVTEERVPAGSYHFMLDLRTANIGETTQLEISIGGQSRLIRIDNNWTSLEFLLRTEQAGEISISFRGGPLAFYTQDYDIANLALRTLDNRKIEINAFDHTDFENPALATRGMSYGGKGMTFTHMTETVGEGEDAVTNSFVRIADRVRNYDNLFLNTGVKMEAGETYTITYDIRLAEPEGKDTMRSQVGIPNSVTTKLRVDPNQNSEYTNANYNAFEITPEWKTVTATFVAAESGTMVIGINGGASTENIKSYDIDNLIIMAKVAPTIRIGDNKWEAGNFEDAATALAAWKGEANANLGWVGGKIEHRTDEDGNSYINISEREANYQNFTLNTGVSVSAGATYQITYRIRAVEDTRLRSSAGAASAKNYKLKVAGEGADDPASSSYHAFAVPTQWKTITTLYTAETDGVLGINFYGDTSPIFIHNLDFDDFEIYEVYAG